MRGEKPRPSFQLVEPAGANHMTEQYRAHSTPITYILHDYFKTIWPVDQHRESMVVETRIRLNNFVRF